MFSHTFGNFLGTDVTYLILSLAQIILTIVVVKMLGNRWNKIHITTNISQLTMNV